MKITLIYEFLQENGGIERLITNHADFLMKEGHEVSILTCHLGDEMKDFLKSKKIKVYELPFFKSSYLWINLLSCFLGFNKLKKYKIDLFISYSFPASFLIRNKKQKKIFYMNHLPNFLYLKGKDKLEWANTFERKLAVILSWILGPILSKLDKKLVKENSLIFSNSNFTKNKIDKNYNVNSVCLYPDLDKIFNPSKKKIKEKYIFSPGRIIPDKKFDWLINSLVYSKNKLPLYISGSGNENYIRELKKLASKNKIEINFLGRLNTNKLVEYYSNAEILAYPTPGEDFGLVPAESLACGTPVVVWEDGAGPTEQIKDKINGYYAKPYDLKDFAKKIDLCINEDFKRKNREKILNSSKIFSHEFIQKKFIKEINKIIHK